jgi:hypothetical protein
MEALVYYDIKFNKWTINIYNKMIQQMGSSCGMEIPLSKQSAGLFGMNPSKYVKELAKFGGRRNPYDGKIYFSMHAQANLALKWIESLIIMAELR